MPLEPPDSFPAHSPSSILAGPPSPWVVRFAPLVRPHGPVLDVACGSGRHLRHFLNRGHPVTGVDRDLRGVRDLADRTSGANSGVTLLEADLENGGDWPVPGTFAAVIVTNYLYRPIFPALLAALEPGGVLIYETFAQGNQRLGRPSSAGFLLRPGELLEKVSGRCLVVAYEHGEVSTPRSAVVQRLCAVNDLTPAPDLDGAPAPRPLPPG